MRSRMWILVVLFLMVKTGAAQDAKAVLQAVDRAMGASTLRSVQYSGSGWTAAFGQSHDPAGEYRTGRGLEMPSYTRTINYEAKSSKEDYTRIQGHYPPQGGGGTPIRGEQRRAFMVAEDYAWNMQGSNPVPAFNDAEQRQLEIWLTPHGFVKAGLAATT